MNRKEENNKSYKRIEIQAKNETASDYVKTMARKSPRDKYWFELNPKETDKAKCKQ